MAFLNCLKLCLRLKHTETRVGDLLVTKKKYLKHWSNESVKNKVIDKREKLLYEKGERDAERRWTSGMDDEDAALALVDRETLIARCIEQVDHVERVKQLKTIERKYFKKPRETNLLTWAMKEKIRYLHHTDPETWTVEELSKGFPIGPEGVKKLLKSKFVLKTPEAISRHDQVVAQRWRKVGKVGGPIAVKIENAKKNTEMDLMRLEEGEEPREDLNSNKIGMLTSILLKSSPETSCREPQDAENNSKMNQGRPMTAEVFRKQAGIETKPQRNVGFVKNEEKIEYDFSENVSKYKYPRERTDPDAEERLVQRGDTFYDEKGRFVYRIPGLNEHA